MTELVESDWQFAKPVEVVREKKAVLARVNGKQIALFDTPSGIRACNNRCPHEGYPLSEGSVSGECTLTCNWHNWKFDLNTGTNFYGGDQLRTYPVEVRGDDVWVNIAEPPFAQRHAKIIASLRDAFDDHEYDRIAREVARLIKVGGDPLDALRYAINWSWQKMEFGTTHAFAGMADWLLLYHEKNNDPEAQLVCLLESIAHAAFDVLREPDYPFSDNCIAFDESGFLSAIENEDEASAVAMLRGGIRAGMQFANFERSLSTAALAHYNDFGHSLIYVTKVGYLIDQLGDSIAEPLLLSLVRAIIFASREDHIPEFRGYASALDQWAQPESDQSAQQPDATLWRGAGINNALDAALACRQSSPDTVYRALLVANAHNLLHFDIAQQTKVRVSVSGNVGWLDFTHGVTFANAVRQQCEKFPELWPQGLLQMACFSGRNTAFTNDADHSAWAHGDLRAGFEKLIETTLDHGQPEYIISVHWIKTVIAAREECERLGQNDASVVFAAVNRFIHSPLKRRQALRTAYQSINFVNKE
ncbi:MAG: Rieske 2Fe-2S domain-containing protein [Pseudomonadota bacterium]